MLVIVGRITMTTKILKSIISVVVAVLISSLVFIICVLYPYFSDIQESQLKDELNMAAYATEQLEESFLENLDYDHYRLTWIESDGTVIFDSHADITTMENHSEREEVKEALISGKGSSTRNSTTLTQKTIYEATRLKNGSILRISVSRDKPFVLVLGMIPAMTIVLVIGFILSVWLAQRMAKRVVEPLNKLNLDNPLENDIYEELSPLLHRIHTQHTEIKNQMITLKQKQEEFNQITSNMKDALIILDNTEKILSINPAALALFNTKNTCIGEDLLTIERKQNMRLALAEAKTKGRSSFKDKKYGKDYLFELSCIESDGTKHGMVIFAFDISEQVNAEKHRQEFTANVSHELKTPLQSIIGSAELMENGIVKNDDIPRFVKRIRKEASRLVTLIDDIIRLSQLDERTDMPLEDVSLLALSKEVCETLSSVAKTKNISLEVSGDNAVINGVHSLLYEIIYNLCDNAIKYNNPGGNVKVFIEQKQDVIQLSVKDTGIGIPFEHQDKIFERFYRVDKSHSKQSGGTGLGLSIVKHAVQYHHGKITMNSEVNKGTTISIQFKTK